MSVLGYYVNCDDAVCVGCWNPDEKCKTCGGTLGMPRDASRSVPDDAVFGVFPRYVTNGIAEADDPKYVVCSNQEHWDGFEAWDEPQVILSDEESDTPTHCVECHELIPHALTSQGYEYVREHIINKLLDGDPIQHPDGLKVVRSWWERYGDDMSEAEIADIAATCFDLTELIDKALGVEQ